MGLLDKEGAAQTAAKATGATAQGSEATAKAGDGKSKAYEYQKKLKEKRKAGAERILANKAYNLDPTDRAFLEGLTKVGTGTGGGNFGTPIFNKLFGDTPAVGAKVTLQEVFDKTYKGKAQMDSQMKKWKEKSGIEIDFAFNKDKPAQSTYTIKSLGN